MNRKEIIDSFEVTYNNLNEIDKKAINAYRSAREFKIAAENNGRIEFFYKNKHTTIKPCIVNYALSCELFFKSMIIIKNNKLVVKTHKLDDLYEILDNSKIKNELSKYDFDIEIKKISDAFIDWRYCYEHNELTIHTGFLIDLCNCLEKNNRLIILEKYGLNMNESFI